MRQEFINYLNDFAGNYQVQSVGTLWHDVDKMEDEFTAEEGFTVIVKKNKIEYTKDFFGAECIKPIPDKLRKEEPDLSITEYNARRIIEGMEIK